MTSYAMGSAEYLEMLQTDIAFDLNELSKYDKKIVDRIFRKLEDVYQLFAIPKAKQTDAYNEFVQCVEANKTK